MELKEELKNANY